MLYGNIIFIKKTGGDGSKYPVSEKIIKIGRAKDCLIRIYNTQVALEHCQLIIGENGQATLKDLSNQTFLNGNILANEEVALRHGDIFKVGERLARWEYLPTSKYYRQLLSPPGRLVAVVLPQQRCLEDQLSGSSASVVSALKNTPVGRKRSYSERFASENTSAVSSRKSGNSNLIRNTKGNFSKLLTGRHSLKTKKLLPIANIKDRKSTSGIINSKTPKGKLTKSTLPVWKVNLVSPPSTNLTEEETCLLTNSEKSSNSRGKTLTKDTLNSEPEELLLEKKNITPRKTVVMSEENIKSASKNVLKTPVRAPIDSPLRSGGSTTSTWKFNKSPSPRKLQLISTASKSARLIHSEKKLKFSVGKSLVNNKEFKRLSLVLNKVDKVNGNNELHDSFSHIELKRMRKSRVSDIIVHPILKYNSGNTGFPGKREKRSIKTRAPEKFDKTSNKSPQNKALRSLNSSESKVKTPKVNESEKALEEFTQGNCKKKPSPVGTVEISVSIESDGVINSKEGGQALNFRKKSITAKSTPLKKTPKKIDKNVEPSCTRKNLSKSPPRSGTSARSSKSSSVRNSLRKSISLSKEKISSSKGVRRKLSPSISSAERAAKKLKTSSPKKPDKNKKAALLVLGKANRKQFLSQHMKVLLKQKIVKKAIKQSTLSSDKVDSDKKESITVFGSKSKKVLRKNISKGRTKTKKKNCSTKENTSANSSKSPEVPIQINEEVKCISKGENGLEGNKLLDSKSIETSPRSPTKFKNVFNEAPLSISSKESSSPFQNIDKAAENFLFNSNRRCSKRLSSKNDLGRPDFIELSPTALGLIPKNVEVFKSLKQNKRKSSSLVTPRNAHSLGIIRSASTSKIGTRKNVRFSSKDTSFDSEFCSPSEKIDFDFGAVQTPDVSVEDFISPLGDTTSGTKKGLNETPMITFASDDNSELALTYGSTSESKKCIRKLLQSPEPRSRGSSNQNELQRSRICTTKVRGQPTDIEMKNSESNLSNFGLDVYTTPKNNLSDINGVLRLLRGSKSDSNDIKAFSKFPTISKVQKSPKNDLSDVRGVKKLMRTPKVQKSPKNDLSDVKGVRKLMATPKVQKSPKNDLSDVRGVKKLMRTPKVQKSPKNDLSDVRGVKKLMRTPKVQKSPKNDLSDVKGVRKLMATPKVQKSVKNDLTDVAGVKELFRNLRAQKSPKNELLDLSGVRQLLRSPKRRRSAKSNSTEKSFELFEENIIESHRNQKQSKNSADFKRFSESDELDRDATGDKLNADGEVVRKSQERNSKSSKSVSRKLRTSGLRPIKGRRTSKEPKNDLSDVTGVRELFTRNETSYNSSEILTGVRRLFNLADEKAVSTPEGKVSGRRSKTGAVQKAGGSEKDVQEKDEYIKTRTGRRGVLSKANETPRRSVRVKSLKIENKVATEVTQEKFPKRKVTERTKPSEDLKSPIAVKRSERLKKETERSGRTKAEPKGSEGIKTRKRKADEGDAAGLPPKLPRKHTAESARKTTSRSKTASVSVEKIPAKTVRKASAKAKSEASKSSSKPTAKTCVERIPKVQKKRSQNSSKEKLSDSKKKLSPRKTRSAKTETAPRNGVGKRGLTAGSKISESRARGKKLTTTAKRSTRRK